MLKYLNILILTPSLKALCGNALELNTHLFSFSTACNNKVLFQALTKMLAKLNNVEACLKTLTFASIFIALYALIAGILTYLTALLLNGTLSVFDVASTLLALLTAKILKNAQFNKIYPYGYFKIEPMLIAMQAVFILAVCSLSLVHSCKDLFHHTAGLKNYG